MDKYLQIFLYISGFIVGMILLLYLLPKANCYEYDVEAERCILGDCTALKNLICCMKRDGDGAGIGPRRLRSRDAVDLQTIGAFTIGALTDPVAYLYNDTMGEEKRTQLLDVIIDTELVRVRKQSNTTQLKGIDSSGECCLRNSNFVHSQLVRVRKQRNTTQLKGIDPSGEDEIEENVVDNDEESNIKEHKHKSIAEEDQACCSICLQELDSDECKIRKCKHAFHKACIKSWISRSLSCPVCREDMITRDKLLAYMFSFHLMDMEAS